MIGIYKITNQINGKSYIGQSVNITRRWSFEKKRAFSPKSSEYDKLLSRAFRKYGVENFIFEVVEECSAEDLNGREEYWANYYNTYVPNGYNVSGCGDFIRSSLPDDIKQIYVLLEKGESNQQVAAKTGKSWRTVSDINCGKAWRCSGVEYPIRKRIVAVKAEKQKKPQLNIVKFTELYCNTCQNKGKIQDLAQYYGVTSKTIRVWVKNLNLPTAYQLKPKTVKQHKVINVYSVIQYNEKGEYINSFVSASQASSSIFGDDKNASHIIECCKGMRSSAGGYLWKFAN